MTGSSKTYPGPRPLIASRYAELAATGAGLPAEIVTNQNIIDECNLIASDRAVQHSIGIKERRRGAYDEKVSRYLCEAAEMCLARANLDAEKIDRIIYTKLIGEHLIPATALRVLERLGVKRGIPVTDISAACSGFMHALELGISCINAGDDYVLVLGGDRSAVSGRAAVVKDTRTIFLNGDGFAAALLAVSTTQKFLSCYFYTDSSISHFATIPFGSRMLNSGGPFDKDMLNLNMPDGQNIHKSVLDSCRIIADRLLAAARITLKDIDFFITSDQTTLVWKDQLQILGFSPEQSVSCFHKYGNTVAAMTPLNLHEAIITGKLKRGMLVMMMAHGAGASGGGFIFRY